MGGRSFREIPVIPLDVPDPGFLPVAHVLFPEQVVAGITVIRDGHVKGTLWVFAILHRHLDIDRTEVRVGDCRAGVQKGFFHVPAMILLRLAPLDLQSLEEKGILIDRDLPLRERRKI